MSRHEQTTIIYCNLKVNRGIIAVEKRQRLSQPVKIFNSETQILYGII